MLSIQKILCTTDFSEPSYEAIKIADSLAYAFSAEIIVLHVVTPIPVLGISDLGIPGGHVTPAQFDVPAYQDEMVKNAQKTLEQLIKTYISESIRVSPQVILGIASDEITAAAKREKADMIVIATHGHTGWRHFILGSVTEKVIRHAPCYVFSVPMPSEDE